MWNLDVYADKTALKDENGFSLSYCKLKIESEKIANIIARRCLVFSLCTNEIGSVVGYVGFINSKIVPVLLNANMEHELISNLLELYSPAYLWMPKNCAKQFENMTEIYSAYSYVLLKTSYEKEYPLYSELGLLLTTSGSTGSPKFVRQSYDNILNNTQAIVEYLGLNCNERPITTLPMNYTYGLSIINTHLFVGATILVTEKSLMQKAFWDFFKLEGATSLGGVPYTYEMLDRMRIWNKALPSLITMTQAGGKLTPELHEKFAKFALQNGKKFVVMYGQCEATARMGYLPADKAVEKKGSMGIPIPGGKFHLIDVNGEIINKAYTTGELVYQGKNVTLGYALSGDDLIKADERNGILQTGDMAQFDDDGYYYIVGRKKRFLKIYGNRINLDEIERMIKGKFGIECASSGIDDHLYIFVTDTNFIEKVKRFVSEKTRLNSMAFKVIAIPLIPKNEAGKILYKDLAAYY
ncbi:AMP-binding protein [Holdemania massiliensis]|uniref:AMP-binding protein n=1 Tax=Holdemania massiliensis TaxID=1468449 RepID=A0A6N7S3U1_9FIRM|nr:AMP-binding protein [Holdemania massiliensis]MSA70576.1 AMP-binding protein [Holdemania massiliensis]MSA88449.1 AMP-binding protein [Holdemania massiliensis]MSB77651.1 AMP-binding protein [Holdemania massiliensis]MSC32577.1 AMP-binding protein [Holdemania massiliensis]MSC38897.1 AMP-binding protein [Holdemania massiliensis]